MKFCTNCGAQLPEGGKFCPECGQKFLAPEPDPMPDPTPEPAPAPAPAPAPEPQTYEAPAQSYTAPAQSGGGSFTPPPQGGTATAAKPPKQPKEKKPISRGVLFGILGVAVVALIAIVIALVSGGKAKDDPNLGRYEGVSCVLDGIDLGAESDWIELKAKDKAALSMMGSEVTCEWSLDGETFTLKESGDNYPGTLKDGVLTVDIGGMVYTFVKEGAAAPEVPQNGAEAAAETGYWILLRVDATGGAMSEEDVATFRDLGYEFFLTLDEDGTGALVFFDDPVHVTWGNGKVNVEGEGAFNYSLDGDELHLDVDGSDYVFTRGEGVAPKIDWSATEEPEEPEEPEAPTASVFTPVTGTINGCTVSICGAELFEDIDGKDAIRVYWEFTNDTDDTTYANYDILCKVEQEGFELNSTYTKYGEEVPESGYANLNVRPGVTVCCASEYTCKADGDIITFMLHEWSDESKNVTATLDPKNLPGRPADTAIATISDPGWTEEMSYEGDVNDAHVYIDTAEIVDGYDGEPVIRVYFDYTNIGDETSSMWWSTYTRAFQDGVELMSGWADEEVPEDGNYNNDVEPGDSLSCALCWVIRSDSPVEIEVYDSWSGECVGCRFRFALN